jgi:pimeloyl-ACP methyl ester carboxylesterase
VIANCIYIFGKIISFAVIIILAIFGISNLDLIFPKYNSSDAKDMAQGQAQDAQNYYKQIINWQTCLENGFFNTKYSDNSYIWFGFRCAKISVPKNWQKPNEGNIELALNIHLAKNATQKTIIVNPGGPGASGVKFLASAINNLLPSQITDNFNILSFDPRGVGLSNPIECFANSSQKDEFIYKTNYKLPQQVDSLINDQTQMAKNCQRLSGDIVNFVDTQSTARDLDLIRALTGEPLLNYIGFSYGSSIGEVYAALFPKTIGKVVLDGITAPNTKENADKYIFSQARGFSASLEQFIKYCSDKISNCPLDANIDQAKNQISIFFDQLSANPLDSKNGQKLTDTAAFYGIAAALYSKDLWDYLGQSLYNAMNKKDPYLLMQAANLYNDREDDFYKNNTIEANLVISCLDNKSDIDLAKEQNRINEYKKQAPVFYKFLIYQNLACSGFSKSKTSQELKFWQPTNNKIILIASTGDPATPYEEALSAVKEMGNNTVLITNNSFDHTSYNKNNKCIAKYVNDYILENKLPENKATCFDS